jgi:signal transduction histidine kinase
VIGNERARSIAEDLWQEGRVLVGDAAARSQAFRRFLALGRAHRLGAISQSLITTRDVEELADVLATELPRLDVIACYVSLYDDRDSRECSTLVLGVEEGGVARESIGARFPTASLVPDGVLAGNRTLVVMPLSFHSEQLGLIVLEVPADWQGSYDELRKQFGAAFKRIEAQRELERAYQAVRENQEKLLISEKMASLGRLTAGMAHEMNTPLAAVRAALEELARLAAEYRESIGDPSVTPDDHREIVGEMQTSIKLAGGAAESVAGFVSGIKAKTRDLSSAEYRDFNAVPVIQESLLLLQHVARKAHCDVAFEHENDTMVLFGAPGRLSQVITNLVTNAIDATADMPGGRVSVRLARWDRGLDLSVTDNGSGIAAENLKRIFDPMFTTKPFGVGTGLGLTIVHDIVTGDFDGTIDVDTQPGERTTFQIRFKERQRIPSP